MRCFFLVFESMGGGAAGGVVKGPIEIAKRTLDGHQPDVGFLLLQNPDEFSFCSRVARMILNFALVQTLVILGGPPNGQTLKKNEEVLILGNDTDMSLIKHL